MKRFDLIVIGAGPGGYVAAFKAAREGLSVAVVEKEELGGVCINRGCIPTKSLLYASALYEEMRNCGKFGLSAEGIGFDMEKINACNEQAVRQYREEIRMQFLCTGVELLRGTGRLLHNRQVEVASPEKCEVYQARSVILATGARPRIPKIPGIGLPGVLTSEKLLSVREWNFDRFTIIGGGVIGIEFATIFHAFGAKVTVIERRGRILYPMDVEIAEAMQELLRGRGIDIRTGAAVEEITEQDGALVCRFREGQTLDAVTSDRVLTATGRAARVDGVFADGLPVRVEHGRIVVDGAFMTDIPGVYAIGDVIEGAQLAHVASAQGTYVVERICGKTPTVILSTVPSCAFVDLPIVPSCLYTNPEIASVGITEEMAVQHGIPVRCGRCHMSGNGKSIITGASGGFIKLLFERHSNMLIGAQMMCPRATDMIGEMATAIANGLTSRQLMYAMRAHPTYNEGVSIAVEDSLRHN